MKFPWQKAPEFFIEEKQKKPRETLASVADKLLIRKMKRDPDGYGIEAAKKIKGMRRDESKGVIEQLKEFRELKKVLADLGGEGGGGGGILQTIIENLPAIIQTLPQAIGAVQQSPQVSSPQPKLVEMPKEEPVNLSDLTQYLDMEPEQAFEELKSRYPQWVSVLKLQSYGGIIKQLEQFRGTKPELDSIIDKLASDEGKKWLQMMLKLAKSY